MTMATIAAGCMVAAAVCATVQFFVKRTLPLRQYGYFRDILLSGVWLILAIWFGSETGNTGARVVVGCAVLAGVAGLVESVYSDTRWRVCYLLLGALCAWLGPSIHFIHFADGEYIYLTPTLSFCLTALWFAIFPVIFFHLDETPGLTGHLLAVTFTLMLIACLLTTGPNRSSGLNAFFMTFSGVSLLAVFWSRFGNAWRQAGSAMAAMWSFLAAGTAILGSSKGIVFSSVFFLSLGLFALPMAELSLRWVAHIFTEQPSGGHNMLYRRMIARGLEHPEAIRFVAGICALISIIVALLQSTRFSVAWMCWAGAGLMVIAFTWPLWFHRSRNSDGNSAPNFIPSERPVLWGVPLDNVSMNYAVTRARGLISNPMGQGVQLVATVNALGMIESVHDSEYRKILKQASLVLADGTGLLWGTRFLGMPVQERVTGIDFAEQLCRIASSERENWPVYFLGGKGDIAQTCAEVLAQRYPGLVIAGAHDGYFDLNDTSIPDAVVESGAKILLVAMGIPRQEKWAALHSERLGPILTVGVGGAFDVFAGHLNRAPRWVQKIGMEWFYRLLQEPFRWRRDLELFSFVMRVFASRIGLCSIRDEPKDESN